MAMHLFVVCDREMYLVSLALHRHFTFVSQL